MSRTVLCAALVAVASASAVDPVTRAQAALAYLSVPSISGENPTPGYPGAMAVQSVTVIPHGFSVVKNVDAASPGISGASS